jgi:glycolate oxidase FAD binding subunit
MLGAPATGSPSGFAPAGAADIVDGVTPSLVAHPTEQAELRAAMAEASAHRLAVVVRGRGTKIDWGHAPARLDAVIDVSRLDRVIEHVEGDLVVRVEPGLRLADLRQRLSAVGQRLSIDEVVPGSTVGGVVATGLSGPRRLLSGGVRDLLIGATVIRADGKAARTGGKVVKNVAGYDLGKLYTGSYGTLGVLSEAIFRLHPLPAAAAWVSASLPDEQEAGRVLQRLLTSQLAPTAIELDRPVLGGPLQLAILLEGLAEGVADRSERAGWLLGSSADTSESAPLWWASLPGPTTIKVTTTISGVPDLLRAVESAAAAASLAPEVRASPGLGIVYGGLPDSSAPDQVGTLVRSLREHCRTTGGSVVVLQAPAPVKAAVDVWGPVPAIELMRRVKANFDPDGAFAPGRFVGGI